MRRKAAIAAFCLVLLLVLAGLAYEPVVHYAVDRVLLKVSKKVGQKVVCEDVSVQGLTHIRIERLRVGPDAKPVVTIRSVAVDVDARSLRRFSPWADRIEIIEPTLHLHSGGHIRNLVRELKALKPKGLSSGAVATTASDESSNNAVPRALPEVVISGARLLDHGGIVDVVAGQLTISDERVKGQAELKQPNMGLCNLTGDFDGLDLHCARPYKRTLFGGLWLELSRLSLTTGDDPSVRLPEVRVASTAIEPGVFGAVLQGISVDALVGLKSDEQGKRALKLALKLPGGGLIDGRGTASLDEVELSANVKALRIGPAHKSLGGLFSGRYRILANREKKSIEFMGEGDLSALTVEHPALADAPVGPFDMGLSGEGRVKLLNLENKAVLLELDKGTFRVGDASVEITASIDTTPGARVYKATMDTGKLTGKQINTAFPPGLLQHLQPLKFRGPFSARVELDMNEADLEATKLKFKVNSKRLKVRRISKSIDFDGLRERFKTRFEMPGENEDELKVIVRETGPLTERWTPLEEIAPLLPLAVMAQEDGGFYKHSGISTYHLRGSLVLNMSEGRFARGGSTITMQLARNLFLNRRKTLSRKLEELILAWLLERAFEKDELMALYLNVVEFGPEIFGVKDAVAHYWNKTPAELTPPEVAWLVRLLPSPRPLYEHFEKRKLSVGHTRSINRLLGFLVKKGHLLPEAYEEIGPEDLFPPEMLEEAEMTGEDIPPQLPVIPIVPPRPSAAPGAQP